MSEFIQLISSEDDESLFFDIIDVNKSELEYELTLKSEFEGKIVGFKIMMPIIIKKLLFKKMELINYNLPMQFESIGEESDNFIKCLEKLWKPDFQVSGKFIADGADINFAVKNREIFNIDQDKIYMRLFYNEEEQSDEFEKIQMELDFDINLGRKRATISQTKPEYKNDFIALIME